MIHHAFDPMKIMYSYQMSTEMLGDDKLELMADMIYGDSDPTEVYATESPMVFETVDGLDIIRIKMPFVEKKDIELMQMTDDTIMIHVGSQKRIINLPLTLAKEEMVGAEFKSNELILKFRR